MNLMNSPLLVLALSFLVLSLAVEIGDTLRKRVSSLREEERADFGVVLSATLTLLGLLIGFSFSMAVSRYDQRKNLRRGRGQRDRHRVRSSRPAA